jgi:hypothetical protein
MPLRGYREKTALIFSDVIIKYIFHLTSVSISLHIKKGLKQTKNNYQLKLFIIWEHFLFDMLT